MAELLAHGAGASPTFGARKRGADDMEFPALGDFVADFIDDADFVFPDEDRFGAPGADDTPTKGVGASAAAKRARGAGARGGGSPRAGATGGEPCLLYTSPSPRDS